MELDRVDVEEDLVGWFKEDIKSFDLSRKDAEFRNKLEGKSWGLTGKLACMHLLSFDICLLAHQCVTVIH